MESEGTLDYCFNAILSKTELELLYKFLFSKNVADLLNPTLWKTKILAISPSQIR